MRLSARSWRIGLVAASLLSLIACAASTDDGDVPPVVDADGDGGGSSEPIIAPDGGVPSSQPDADAGDAALDGDSAAVEPCSVDNWCHVAVPPDQTLRDVWGDGAGTVWSVSEQGSILRWNGAQWTISHTVTGALYAIWGSSPTDIWVGGENGLFHGQGPNSSSVVWTAVATPATLPVLSMWGSSGPDVWAVAGKSQTNTQPFVYEGQVLHYTGPAAGWVLDPISSQRAAFSRVWGAGSSDVWIGGDMSASKALVLRGAPDGDGGTAWTEEKLSLRRMTGGAAIARDSVLILGNDLYTLGTFFTGATANGGDTFDWVVSDYATGWTYFDAWGPAPNDIWLAGAYGRLHHWDGSSWSIARTAVSKFPIANALHAIWGSGTDDVWVVGDNIALHKRAPVGGGN
jgi:hypothetical protein